MLNRALSARLQISTGGTWVCFTNSYKADPCPCSSPSLQPPKCRRFGERFSIIRTTDPCCATLFTLLRPYTLHPATLSQHNDRSHSFRPRAQSSHGSVTEHGSPQYLCDAMNVQALPTSGQATMRRRACRALTLLHRPGRAPQPISTQSRPCHDSDVSERVLQALNNN